MVLIMALLISTPSPLCSTSTSTKSPIFSSFNSTRKIYKVYDFTHISLLGLDSFSQWSGLKNLGISIIPKSLRTENKGRCKGKVVYASLFGVGAPEALVIGVVALLVFGPKGLAEVARNLGKTLREFQPTIRELQDVSREFKSTLEKEIGLDENSSPMRNTSSFNRPNIASNPSSVGSGAENPTTVSDPNGSPSPKAYTTEELLEITEEQLKASTAMQESQTPPPGETKSESQTPHQTTVTESTGATPPPQKLDSES